MGIHACAPKGTDCPALALGSSDAREMILPDAVQRMDHGHNRKLRRMDEVELPNLGE
jgi:hypothetical protein